MFRILLEIADSCELPTDEVIEAQPGPGPARCSAADQEGAGMAGKHSGRDPHRGAKNEMGTLRITKLDRQQRKNEENGASITFFSGNPTVETTKGVLHLFRQGAIDPKQPARKLPDERSTTVCILGVPNGMEVPDLLSYLAPVQQGLLHVRIISDTSPTKYMALLRFDTQAAADEFYANYNGKPFSALEPELCHAVFVDRVEAANSRDVDIKLQYGVTELPPCAVCLERMDESVSGIFTTLCNHSFHCQCMKSWEYTSCPVCRHLQKPAAQNECMVCAANTGLWICLICGHIGCGRYLDQHSYQHFVSTQHTYAMELETQRVWDYVGDNYVHRLIQNTEDGKPVELGTTTGAASSEEKVESLTLEYTYLLTSQLESQRRYFTEKLGQREAEARAQTEAMGKRLAQLDTENKRLVANQRALQAKYDQAARDLSEEAQLTATLQENQRLWEERIRSLEAAMADALRKKDDEIAELKDQVRDLMFCIEARDRIDSAPDREELQDGHIFVAQPSPTRPQPPAAPRRKSTPGGKKR